MDGSSGTGSNANSSAGPFTSEESASQSHRQKTDIAWAYVSEDEFDGDEVQAIPIIHTKGITINEASAPSEKGKRKATTPDPGIHNFFKGGYDNSQPTIKAILQSKEKWHNCEIAIARWFYDACIPINVDIGQMNDVKAIVSLASSVTVFVYNHKYTLNWLRKTKGWKEIIRPGETRFVTTFIALKSLHDHKESLQALVTSGDYKKFLKIDIGKEVKQIVLDEKFWNNCLITMRIMGPLIRLFRVCDTDERPSLGYVYEGMYRAINGIKKLFKNKERFYKPYTDIINERWDRMLRKNLHVAAYYLNPAFQYDPTFSTHPEITNGFFDYIESKSWWKLFGCDAQNLQKFAIRILGQTAFSSGCEGNWSVFGHIHTKKGIDWSIRDLMILYMCIIICDCNIDDGDEAEPEDVNLDLFQRRSVLVDEDDWI
ncbi:hypothetical protein ZIOFF_072192 [Zingiber officinale]|uniref:HAT C-terminal dimerisation domain-containing protein n=1 Tax=Zingiber officinale TaxID=94328 RepID=A0A8J5C2U5_ZINOF|nr:hypothetical protein ZIOFF_072192 [Zingiber officinale]